MRWLTFFLCGGLALTLQSAVAPRLQLCGIRADGLLVFVVFFAMHARLPDAVVGAWIIGACADLMTIERAGLISMSYVLTAVWVASVRDHLFRYRVITQFVVTLMAALLVQVGWFVYRRLLYHPPDPFLTDLAVHALLASAYTAAWAPPVHKVLLAMPGTLGLARPRYTYAGMHHPDDRRV